VSFDPTPLRWIELDIPHPEGGGRMITLRTDGPFALRPYYRAPGSDQDVDLHLDQRTEDGGLNGCIHCGHPELYTRKVFSKPLGIGIVVGSGLLTLATVGSLGPAAYGFLGVAALADAVLYQLGKEETVCYVCSAVHRGFRSVPRHPRFDRTIAERLKFGKSAVMGSAMRDGGTAGAPDPEH
jgi:hypothetical protein